LRFLIITDLDHTMLGPRLESGRAGELSRRLFQLGVPVVPVTAKTLAEVLLLADKIGLDPNRFLVGVENGGAVYASSGLLPDPELRFSVMGVTVEGKELGVPIDVWRHRIEDIIGQIKCDILILNDVELVKKLTGFDSDMARALVERRYDLVLWSNEKRCLERVKSKAESEGFSALLGSRFLHIYKHKGKRGAAEYILKLFGNSIRGPVVALGDSPIDWPMLEVSDIPIVIPRYRGIEQIRLNPRFRVARYPAPDGWIDAVTQVLIQQL